jgi:hypothetical protein
VIKYLVDGPGPDAGSLVAMYERILDGVEPVDALIQASSELPSAWWPDFFIDYVGGEIYSVGPGVFLPAVSQSWEITDEEDRERIFSSHEPGVASYPDLSAKLFKIELESPELDENLGLRFRTIPEGISPSCMKVIVFGYGGGHLAYLGHDTDLTLTDGVRALMNQSYTDLIAVVTNSCFESSYTGESHGNLEVSLVELEEPAEYTRVQLEMEFNGRWRWVDDDQVEHFFEDLYSVDISVAGSGAPPAFFYGEWEDPDDPCQPSFGGIAVNFNEMGPDMAAFGTWATRGTRNDTCYQDRSITVLNMPLTGDDEYSVEGEEVCDFFRDPPFVVYNNGQGKEVRLREVLCDGDSRISLRFFTD